MAYENKTGYPSVTDIIGPYIDKTWFTEEHTIRGSAVHNAIEAFLKGLFVIPLKEDYQPYFDSFRRWFDIAVDDVVMAEERLVDEDLGYCGQMDAILKLKGGDFDGTLADWKTSQSYQPWWRIQGESYRRLAEKEKLIVTDRSISVRLKKDGTGCLINENKYPAQSWNVFQGLLNAHKFFNGGK